MQPIQIERHLEGAKNAAVFADDIHFLPRDAL